MSHSTDAIADATLELGRSVSAALERALLALKSSDLGLADRVVSGDLEINRSRYALEDQVARELERRTDSARLRYLIAVLNVINDLERMGDHAEGIAKVALMLGHPASMAVPESIASLGVTVQQMLAEGLEAFAARDASRARQICDEDDLVDQLYDQVYSELITAMDGRSASVVPTTYLLWVAHNLERIADRVTNVCERTVYLATGQIEELNVSNY